MLNNAPRFVTERLRGESVDFVVRSKHNLGQRNLGRVLLILGGLFSFPLIMLPLFAFPLLEILFTGKSVMTVNGVREVYTRANFWAPLSFFGITALTIMLTNIPGFALLWGGWKMWRRDGSWFAGTNKHLIEFRGERIIYTPWSDFEENIELKMNKDQTMDVYLQRKNTGAQLEKNETAAALLKNSQVSLKINGEAVDLMGLADKVLSGQKVGILGINNGDLVRDMVRHNIERFRA